MKIKTANVFSENSFLPSKVIGNPAIVIIMDDNEEFLPKNKMANFAIKNKFPITVFVKKIKDNNFNIKYFLPNGKELNFCGHGTIAASKIINNLFENDYKEIIFYLNKKNFEYKINNKISVFCNNLNYYSINIDYYDNTIINGDIKRCKKDIVNSFQIKDNDILNFYRCNVLNDYILEVNTSKTLRDSILNKENFLALDKKLSCRAIVLTSKSEEYNIDYEARLFCKGLNEFEDIVCGSSSCYLSTLWSQKLNKNQLNVLFPYKNSKQYFGGVEFIKVFNNNLKIELGGYVE